MQEVPGFASGKTISGHFVLYNGAGFEILAGILLLDIFGCNWERSVDIMRTSTVFRGPFMKREKLIGSFIRAQYRRELWASIVHSSVSHFHKMTFF